MTREENDTFELLGYLEKEYPDRIDGDKTLAQVFIKIIEDQRELISAMVEMIKMHNDADPVCGKKERSK